MTPREALAAKLLAVLSPTEARSCIELLTLAGVPHTRTAPQSGAVALGDLIRRGLARRTGEPTMHRYLAAPASEVGPEERVELPELDATLTFTTKVGRPFGAPSDRTTVAVTCALGPSWPEGTRVPGWSTSLFAHQVAQGGLDAAKHNGTQRMRAALSALRSNPTRDLSPPAPEVPVATPDPTKFLEFTASVKNGARRDTCLSWLKARGLSRLKAEELIEQLQEEGKITAQDFVVAGETITRYLPADPSTRPAPLPVSDAPAEEPEPPVEAVEEPTLIGCVEEPPVCAATLTLSEAIAHADEKGAGEGGCAADHRRLAGWLRELEESRKARAELGAGLGDALQRTADLAREVVALRQERDVLAGERNEALREVEAHKNDFARIAHLLWLPKNFSVDDVFHRAGEYARIARSQAPALDAATIGEYLLDLPEGRWQVIAEARAAIAEGKALQAKGERKIAEGRARLEQLLDTPAGAPAPAPAPELVPATPPAPPPPPAPEAVISAPWQGDTGEAPGTMRDRVLRAFLSQPQREMRAADLADELEVERHDVTAPLSLLTADKKLERVGRGLYRLAKRLARRAA